MHRCAFAFTHRQRLTGGLAAVDQPFLNPPCSGFRPPSAEPDKRVNARLWSRAVVNLIPGRPRDGGASLNSLYEQIVYCPWLAASAGFRRFRTEDLSKGQDAGQERYMSESPGDAHLTPAQQALVDLWDEHTRHEFETRDTEGTLATMVEDSYVNHIPVLTGGVGREQLREFYSKHFIPKMPPDTELVPISRTVGDDQLVDEILFKFTHNVEMDWMLPGIAATDRRVEVPLVVIARFRGGKLAHEHIYWDQASVLAQIGLLDPQVLPIVGVESARKAVDPSLPSNALIHRAGTRVAGADQDSR